MSSPTDMTQPIQYVTRKEVELVKKEIVELKGQINHFKALYQEMKKLVVDIKEGRLDASEIDESDQSYHHNSSNTHQTPSDKSECQSFNSNSNVLRDEQVNGNFHDINLNQPIKMEQFHEAEYEDAHGIVTVPLLYGVIRRNAKKHEPNNNGHLAVVTNKRPNEAVEVAHVETYMHKKKRACSNKKEAENMIPIGSGKTTVPKGLYERIKWNSYTKATRQLLVAVFTRRVLATHSLTGKASPAFMDKPAKLCLDQRKVSDIITEVCKNSKVKENLIRNAITTKCADENKMMKIQAKKRNLTI